MKKVSGHEPKMWGPSIIGFGSYHYKYASGHEGDAPIIGFFSAKAAISLYVYTGLDEHEHLLEGLGKYKIGKSLHLCEQAQRYRPAETDPAHEGVHPVHQDEVPVRNIGSNDHGLFPRNGAFS